MTVTGASGAAGGRGAKAVDSSTALDAALLEIDIQVDEMKGKLEGSMDGTIADLKRIVEAAIVRLPPRIKNMTMQEFMSEYGGDVAQVIERDRKLNKIARTVAKGGAASLRGGATVFSSRTLSRTAGARPTTAAGRSEEEEASTTHLSATTPSAAGARSRVAHGDGVDPSTMKSMMVPPTPLFNPLLPKTPATRRARRGEVVYGMSANGSPLGPVHVDAARGARASVSVKTLTGTTGSSSATMHTSSSGAMGAAVELVVDDLVLDNEAAVAAAVTEKGDAVFSAIEAMQAKLEAMKAAAELARASVAPSAMKAAPHTLVKPGVVKRPR